MKEIVRLPVPKHQKLWKDYLQCECGCASISSDKHSEYCPKYKGEQKCKPVK